MLWASKLENFVRLMRIFLSLEIFYVWWTCVFEFVLFRSHPQKLFGSSPQTTILFFFFFWNGEWVELLSEIVTSYIRFVQNWRINFKFLFIFSWQATSPFIINKKIKNKKKTVSHISIFHLSLNGKNQNDTSKKGWWSI